MLVALHGAHVLSWTVAGVEQLYLSPCTLMDGHSAIRGGVPLCFPQFNRRGNLPKHGFARNMAWSLQSLSAQTDSGQIVLALQADARTRALWPQNFVTNLTVDIQPGILCMTLQVHNTGEAALAFTGALHTYLAVDDLARCQLVGLKGQAQWDALTNTQSLADSVQQFDGEFDRVYAASAQPLTLRCGARRVTIAQSLGWANTVVWNPGVARCAELQDMPPDGYSRMLCVEAAQVMQPITVGAGQVWQGWQRMVSTIELC